MYVCMYFQRALPSEVSPIKTTVSVGPFSRVAKLHDFVNARHI